MSGSGGPLARNRQTGYEFRGGGQPLLHPPQLPGQGVGPVHHLRRPLRQSAIVGQAVLLEKLEGGGHLFQIVDFRPAFISGPLALGHALLNVDDQIDALGSCRAGPLLGGLADGGPPVDHRLNVLQAVAVPQGGGPETGGPVLARKPERDRPAPAPLHLDACRLHPLEEVGKVGGPLRQGPVYDPTYLLLVGGRPGRAQPLTVMQKFSLAVELGIFDNGQVMLQTYPVRQPPQGAGRA